MHALAALVVLSCLFILVSQATVTRFGPRGEARMEDVENLLVTGIASGAIVSAVTAAVWGGTLAAVILCAVLGAAFGFTAVAFFLSVRYRRATGRWPRLRGW